MKPATRLLPAVLLAGLLALGGCGKKEEQPTRFNRTLGGTAVGVPAGTAHVNAGILRDPKDYEPTPYEPLEGVARGPAAAGGPEVAAVQGVLRDAMVATFDLDIESVLDTYVAEQVALLREDPYMTTIHDTVTTLEQFWGVFTDKATGSEFQPLVTIIELVPRLAEPIANAMTVTVLDDENAVATLEIERLTLPEDVQAELMAAGQQLMVLAMGAMMAQMAGGGEAGGLAPPGGPPPSPADPNAAGTTRGIPGLPGMGAGDFSPEMFQQMMSGGGMPGMPADMQLDTSQQPQRFRKIDGEWKLVLPFSIQEEQAELINDGLLLVKDFVADLTTEIEKVETLNFTTFVQSVEPIGERFEPAFRNWWDRAQAMIASIMEAQTGAPGATEEAEEPPEATAEDPNAAEPREPSPGPGRRRVP